MNYERMTKAQLIARLTDVQAANDHLIRRNSDLTYLLTEMPLMTDPKSGMTYFEKISDFINQSEI